MPRCFLAERGDELELVVTLTDLAASEVDAIKSSTFESRTFHYDNYTGAVSDFLKKVGV